MKSSNPALRRDRTELAFLPAALEIVETPPSPVGRAIALSIAAMFALALAWAFVGRVDIVSTAKGRVVPTGRVKVIQPFETGVVRVIHVADGQRVAAGEPLIELDPTADRADVQRLRNQLSAANLTIQRLRAAQADALDPTVDFHPAPEAPPDLVAAERRQLVEGVAEQRDRLASLDRQRAEKEAERSATGATIDGLKATIKVETQLLDVYKSLVGTGNGSKVQYLQTLATVTDQEHQLLAQQGHYAQVDATVAAIASSRSEAIAEYHGKLSADLSKALATAADVSQDLIKAERRASLQTLRAPVEGVVQQLAVHTIGGVVTPAQPLLVVVPLDSKLEITAAIPNREIGFIHAGQPAEIKVDAFNYTEYGLLHGKVASVSRDSIASTNPGAGDRSASREAGASEPAGEQLQYDAHIALDQARIFVNGRYLDLRPGMAVTAEIKTGSRRMIDYLLSPFARHAHDSFRER